MPHSSKRVDGATSEGRSGERSSSSRNSNQNDDNSPSGRRDENLASLSFRHFLQPHSDVVPTTTTRHGRNVRGSASIDLVDGVSSSMALPDFVQDHLVLESLVSSSNTTGGGGNNPSSSSTSGSSSSGGGNHHHHHHLEQQGTAANTVHGAVGGGSSSSSSSLDMSVLSAILPDFTTSQRNQSCLSKRNRRQENSTNNGEGACSLPSSSSSSSSKVALPDFLSDGPMLCSSDGLHHNSNISSSSSSPHRSAGASASSLHNRVTENSSRDSDLTAANMDRLRRELAERNRRLSQLESDFNIARNEASMFEAAYLTAQQNLDAANRQISKLKSDLALLKDQFNNEKSTRRRDNSNAVDPSTSTPPTQRNVPIHYTTVDVTALSAMHHYLTESLKQLEKIYPSVNGNGITLDESNMDKEKKK